ncbi:ABC transporter ATP-binding protein [Prosthecomicrobium hirschii]|uniref:ABC transporter ATP-binding protein n=1 Tax=Prosthecodimorpha hirschii TaxID=665126 RepID=UPI00221ED491|nr:ABC transporter ATP-binding protein [Prosthecomicrobium hirschii]MCW1840273.1 ABC transporter ATP-binding protein [Prosthecomicrobium hirschii]
MSAGPVLDIRGLEVAFDTRRGVLPALRGVSFEIAAGEILGVVGESGAGKSLTGTAVIGLLEPPGRVAGGAVMLEGTRIDGLDANAMRRIRGRRIGVVFQDPLTSLNPLIRVGDQLVETIRAHLPLDRTAAEARALALLKEVGIPAAEERIGQYPHQFSGGMRQRVVIALALAADPVLLVADEPTTALDVSIQAQITSLIKRLCRERGMAVMLVTHDMGVIAETADRVAVMYAGRVVEIGPVAEVLRRPRHPYTAGLMASIPSMRRRNASLAQIDGSMPRLDAMPQGCAFHPRCPKAEPACRAAVPPLAEIASGAQHGEGARAEPALRAEPSHRAACIHADAASAAAFLPEAADVRA